MPSVLIVDDHARFRAVAARMLGDEGFTVAGEAADGAGALELAARLRPEVVLLDVGLPDVNGIDLAGTLAQTVPEAAVVLVSTRDAQDYDERAVAAGARGFVPKHALCGDALRAVLDR